MPAQQQAVDVSCNFIQDISNVNVFKTLANVSLRLNEVVSDKKMKLYSKLMVLGVALIFYACQDHNTNVSTEKKSKKDSLSEVYIRLYPSFINFSTIKIDRIANVVTFTVDSLPKYKIAPFTTSLSKYESLTDIKAFYDTTFTKLIKRDTLHRGFLDGIGITTFLVTGDKIDTIQSGNDFPKILSNNLVKQITYISDSTKDKALKDYLKELKSYF